MRVLLKIAGAAITLFTAIVGANYLLLHDPVSSRLAADERNAGISLLTHYHYGILPASIVIDLRSVHEKNAPADLWRSLFQAAGVIAKKNRQPDVVLLQRQGLTVFRLKGEDFLQLGREFEAGQNPLFLLRTLPEKLFLPNGDRAFESWSGGLLGVLGKQMEDLNSATATWATKGGVRGQR